MSLLQKNGTRTIKYIFTRELKFCYQDLSLPNFPTAIYNELVEEGYDLIWFYHHKYGGYTSRSMQGIFSAILPIPNTEGGKSKNKVAMRSRSAQNNTSKEEVSRESENNKWSNGGQIGNDAIVYVLEKLLRFDKEIVIREKERRVPKIAVVLLDVTEWIEKFHEIVGLAEFLQDIRETDNHNQLIVCFENSTFEQFQTRSNKRWETLDKYFPELHTCDVSREKSIISIHSPNIAEINNYVHRLKYIKAWAIEVTDIPVLSEMLSRIASEGKGNYNPETGERPLPCTLADIDTELEKTRGYLSRTLNSGEIPQLTVDILRSVFGKKPQQTGTKRLKKMVGLQAIKEWVKEKERRFVRKKADSEIFRSRFQEPLTNLDGTLPKLHCSFAGNPGTGKTTAARIIGECFYEIGALSSNKFIQCTAKDLLGTGAISSASATYALIQEALGGILFIDEISGLLGRTDPADPEKPDPDPMVKGAISTLLSAMTTYSDLSIMIGGYEKDIRKFMLIDDGLNRRFANQFILKDYNADEMAQLFRKMSSDRGYKIDSVLDVILPKIMEKWLEDEHRTHSGWGNAGEVEKLINHICTDDSLSKIISLDMLSGVKLLAKGSIYYDFQEYIKHLNDNDPLVELQSLVGLKKAKQKIIELNALTQYTIKKNKKIDPKKEIGDMRLNLNFLFLGNPGTGKTTVAKKFGRILTKMGALNSASVVEITVADISSSFINQGMSKLRDKFEEAMGATLFIDEAYSLTTRNDGAGDQEAQKTITELVKLVDEYQGRLCVILAGYTKEMYEFLSCNPGLKRRFAQVIEFDNFSEDELYEIFCLKAKEFDCSEVEHDIRKVINTLISRSTKRDFGNAGEIDNLVNKLRARYAIRELRGDADFVEGKLRSEDFYDEVNNMDQHKNSAESLTKDVGTDALKGLLSFVETESQKTHKRIKIPEYRQKLENSLVRIQTDTGLGSAFIISPEGFAITATHVVENAKVLRARISFADPFGSRSYKEFKVHIVFQDKTTDITLLKIDSNYNKFHYVSLLSRECDMPDFPTEVMLAGFPFGFDFDKPNFLVDIVTSYQDKDIPIKIMLQKGSQHGMSGAMCVHLSSSKVVGLFHGAIRRGDNVMVEEYNYAYDIRQFYRLVEEKIGGKL